MRRKGRLPNVVIENPILNSPFEAPQRHFKFAHNVIEGEQENYVPDFIAVLDDGANPDDPLNLIVEVSGAPKRDKETKVSTAETLWVPAVNNHGGLGRWAFIEITDPWDAANSIRGFLGADVAGLPGGQE